MRSTRQGSLCHGWSAMPVYFYYAYGLGVRPVKAGLCPGRADAARAYGRLLWQRPYAGGNDPC